MPKDELENRISMALKDPILQQGFECICKENAGLKAQIEKMKCCENCKHRYFIGDELECHLLDNGINCDDEEKWEAKEK